jgi:carbon-monoxide dehydrogenase medium subunit
MVGLAASARADGASLREVRLAFFGVGATPVRTRAAENAVERGEDAVAALARDLDPQGDVQASGPAKKHLAGVLLKRVLAQLGEARA